jgi:aminoglycoside phosphotransferase family enzyme
MKTEGSHMSRIADARRVTGPAREHLMAGDRSKREADSADALSLRDKVDYLSRPEAYTPRPPVVETVETHMSWVFLTDRFAYKLKKPIRYDVLDFSSRHLRLRSCQREILLNRRLAPDVYLDVVPLVVETDGGLRLGGSGPAADWLVKMRRLPADRMLDCRIGLGPVTRAEVEPVAALLGSFYANAVPARVDAAGYLRHLRRGIRADREELVRKTYGLPAVDILRVAEEQLRLVRRAKSMLEQRVASGRVVEGHGDLRPEHICLTDPPVVIDCLEFSHDLRMLDPLDELTFLGLECERLGAPEVGAWFMDAYRRAARDEPPPELLGFYLRFRALRRAKVAVWHLRDHGRDDKGKWIDRARWYVDAAVASLMDGRADRVTAR